MATGILVLSHGKMCEGLLDSAQMIFGTIENARALPFLDGEELSDYEERICTALDELGENTLVLVDLFGGTPFNCVMNIGRSRKINAVCGANLPMLIHAADSCDQGMESGELLEELCTIGQQGIRNLSEILARIQEKLEN